MPANYHLRAVRVSEAISRLGLVLRTENGAVVRGGARGPVCEYTTTLPASFFWRAADRASPAAGLAVFELDIDETCLWEPAHPFRYECSLRVESSGPPGLNETFEIGFRTLAIREGALLLNGRPLRVRGLAVRSLDAESMRRLHAWNAPFVWTDSDDALLDRCGLMTFGALDPDDPMASVDAAGPRRPSIGIWTSNDPLSSELVARLRKLDPTVLFARVVSAANVQAAEAPDLLVIEGEAESVLAAGRRASSPWIARLRGACAVPPRTEEDWSALAERWERFFDAAEGCLGWVADE